MIEPTYNFSQLADILHPLPRQAIERLVNSEVVLATEESAGRGSGSPRVFPRREVEVARIVSQLHLCQAPTAVISEVARQLRHFLFAEAGPSVAGRPPVHSVQIALRRGRDGGDAWLAVQWLLPGDKAVNVNLEGIYSNPCWKAFREEIAKGRWHPVTLIDLAAAMRF